MDTDAENRLRSALSAILPGRPSRRAKSPRITWSAAGLSTAGVFLALFVFASAARRPATISAHDYAVIQALACQVATSTGSPKREVLAGLAEAFGHRHPTALTSAQRQAAEAWLLGRIRSSPAQ